jgi:hypothetical protein
MRNFIAAAAVLALLASATPASAQIRLGVAGGPSTPVGGLSDVVNPGVHGGLVLNVGLPLIPISVRGELMVQRLPGAGDGAALDQVWGAANGRLDLLPLPLVGVYVTAGAGLYSSRFDPNPLATPERTTDPGINIGVGADIQLFVVRPFIEARYHRVLTDPARGFVPITVGVFF